MKTFLAVLALSINFTIGAANAQPTSSGVAQIEDVSWLTGRWIGEGLGGQMEEVWSPAADGQMVGHFSLTRDGRLYLYEIMLMDEAGGGLRQRVKHFTRDFTGWEEKDAWHAFDYVAIAENTLLLDGLEYRLNGEDLNISLSLRQHDGSIETETFTLHRTNF